MLRRTLKYSVWMTLLLVAAIGIGFWLRPVSFFRGYSEVHLRLSGAQSRFTIVSGFRIHYYVLGPENGNPLVLIHGLGGRAQDWQNLAPRIAKAGYRVYLPDLPGFGRSDRPADYSYSIADQADVVVGFFDAVGIKQADLGGWSMGGWIVQRVAVSHPERVRKLMLFDSAGLYLKPDWDTALFTPANAMQLAALDELLMPHPEKIPAFVARDILRVSDQNAWVIRKAVASMLTGRDTTDKLLESLRMRVLIVWGAEDRITPLGEGELMHKLIAGSELVVIAQCGHLAPSQCAKPIAPKVIAFLQQ